MNIKHRTFSSLHKGSKVKIESKGQYVKDIQRESVSVPYFPVFEAEKLRIWNFLCSVPITICMICLMFTLKHQFSMICIDSVLKWFHLLLQCYYCCFCVGDL